MLDLIWTAKFKDGSTINQFDEQETQTKEHKFKEILDHQENLIGFTLVNIHTNVAYILNLENGTINITLNGSEELEPDKEMLKGLYKYRLIYFRRVQRYFTSSMVETGVDITYFLGFQYNDEDGKNHKRFVKINSDGRLITN